MPPLRKAFVRNRPHELAGASERPRDADEAFLIFGIQDDALERWMMRVFEQQRRQFGLRRHDVIANRRIVAPKAERTYQDELADAGRISRRDFARDHPAERMSHH